MRFGFVGPSYTAQSGAIADEECINFFAETMESQGSIAPSKPYGGSTAQSLRSYLGTPGLKIFTTLPTGPVRGGCNALGRCFFANQDQFVELAKDGTQTIRAAIAFGNDPVSIAVSNTQLLIISALHAYCYSLSTNAITEVTGSLAGQPIKAEFSDGYFIVIFQNSNKFQMSALLDGTTWPGIQVNAVSVFPENINSIIVNHRELWIMGYRHIQPYQDTGTTEIFDVIPGALIEKGSGATFGPCRLDNSVFWVDEDERGSRSVWRSQGYTPQRVSTHAIEVDLSTYASISGLVTYAYQDDGHLFYVIYVPGAPWSWVFDVAEGLWHKRAEWVKDAWVAHYSWNHVFAFGKHLVGDWNSGNIYEIDRDFLDDNGTQILRLRRSPTVIDEMQWIYHAELTVDFDTGQGPQPPLLDGSGNPRPPQGMLRWSDNRGKTWSNEHWTSLGFAGQYNTRAIWRRLGRSRYRTYEFSISDPIKVAIVDAYLRTS